MVASGQSISDRLPSTVGQQDRKVISVHRIPNRRLYADTSCAAGEDKVFDPKAFEGRIQFGLIKSTETIFVQNNIIRFGV